MNIVTPRDYKAIDLNRCPEGMSADTVSCSCRAKDLLHWVQACFEAFRPQELVQLVVLGALLQNSALQLLPDLVQGLAMFLCVLSRPRWRKS